MMNHWILGKSPIFRQPHIFLFRNLTYFDRQNDTACTIFSYPYSRDQTAILGRIWHLVAVRAQLASILKILIYIYIYIYLTIFDNWWMLMPESVRAYMHSLNQVWCLHFFPCLCLYCSPLFFCCKKQKRFPGLISSLFPLLPSGYLT